MPAAPAAGRWDGGRTRPVVDEHDPPGASWARAWACAWVRGEASPGLGAFREALRERQAARGRPLAPGPASLPGLRVAPGEGGAALLVALAALLGGTADAAGTPARPAPWVLARRPAGEWRFAGTCGALPDGVGRWIERNLPDARFARLECGAWTLDVPGAWLVAGAGR